MATDPRASFSKSSSARGRIAQVLAQARASLNEPTRPVTPQLLDQRTSMPYVLEALPPQKLSKPKKRSSEKPERRPSESDRNFSSLTMGDQFMEAPFTSVDQAIDVLENFAPQEDSVRMSGPSPSTIEAAKKDKPSWNLSKAVNDFVNDLKSGVDSKWEDTLMALDDATKRLKTASVSVSANRLQTTQACLSELIAYANFYFAHAAWIFQLNSAMLRFLVVAASLDPFSLHERSMALSNMEKLSEFIFKSKAQPATGRVASSLEELDISAVSSADQADTVLLLPVLVECLQFTLARLNTGFAQLSSSSSARRGPSGLPMSADSIVCLLLNTASYAMATLRALSTNQETDRKRLLHASGLEVITQMISFYDVYASLITAIRVQRPSSGNRQQQQQQQQHTDNDNEDEEDDEEEATALQSIPVSPLVQTVGVIRNISLDKAGRNHMAETPLCRMLCLFLKVYADYPEVIINIARVMAKLSLYENFRGQISSGPRENKHEYVSCLVSVLRKEADLCLRIMEENKKGDADGGGDEDNDEDVNSWPSWYTWPLISRMAFTLGNFTTTNETNRSLIGGSLGGAESVLLLFQVSVSTLMRIHEVRKKKEEAKSMVSTSVFSFAKGLMGGAATTSNYEPLDGPKDATKGHKSNGTGAGVAAGDEDLECNIDASSELDLRDAIIKLVRLIANLSIDYDVGLQIGSDRENLQGLLDLLTICDSSSSEHEEMLLNVVAALTNLTFYSCQYIDLKLSEDDAAESGVATATNTATHKFVARLDRTLIAIAQRVADGLFHENTEIVLETARVFGNLTRRSSVVQLLFRKRIDEALLLLLTHIHTDVISAVAGVFVNISAYAEGRMLLLQRDDPYFVPHVAGMLRKLTMKDIPIAILLSQILYNVITSADYEQAVKTNKEHRVPPNLFGTLEEWIELVEDAVDQQQQQEEEGKQSDGGSRPTTASSRRKMQRDLQFNMQFIQVAKALSEHIATMGSVSL